MWCAILVSLPVVNLIYPFFFGDVNRTYNEIKLKMIEEGSICLKESELNNLEEMPKTKEEIMEEVVRLREEVNALRNERKQDRVVTANMDIETLRKKALNLQKLAHAVANKEGAFGVLLNDEERKDILRKISKIINEMVRRAQEAVKDTDIEENNFEERLYPLMNQTFTSNDEQYFPEQKTYRK